MSLHGLIRILKILEIHIPVLHNINSFTMAGG